MTAPEALADAAPILHEKNRSEYHGEDSDTPTNIEEYIHHVKGDVEEGFAQADYHHRADLRHGHGASGVHRTPEHDRPLEE